MKRFLPLLLVILGFQNLLAQEEPLLSQDFIPVNDRETGSASVEGNIDISGQTLNLDISYEGLSASLQKAYIHLGSVNAPGPIVVDLIPSDGELTSRGDMSRLIVVPQQSTLTNSKDKSKAFAAIAINSADFTQLATAFKTNNAFVSLQVSNKDLTLRTVFTAPLRTATLAPLVPTMSQWAIFILGMMIACLALIFIRQKSSAAL